MSNDTPQEDFDLRWSDALPFSKALDRRALEEMSTPKALRRGEALFQEGRVTLSDRSYGRHRGWIQANVRDPSYAYYFYTVQLQWNQRGVEGHCWCSERRRGKWCSHLVAAALATWQAERDGTILPPWESALRFALKQKTGGSVKGITWQSQTPYYLAFLLEKRYYGGRERYVLKPIYRISKAKEQPSLSAEALRADLEQQPKEWRPASRTLAPELCLNFPSEVVHFANQLLHTRWHELWHDEQAIVQKVGAALVALRELALKYPVVVAWRPNDVDPPRPLEFWKAPLEIVLHLGKGKGHVITKPGLRIAGQTYFTKHWQVLWMTPYPVLLLKKRWLILLDRPDLAQLWERATILETIRIPARALEYFRQAYLPTLLERFTVSADFPLHLEDVHTAPVPRLYLEEDDEHGLAAELRFAYGEQEFPYLPKANEVMVLPTERPWVYQRLRRDLQAEQEYHRKAASAEYGLKRGTRDRPARLLLRKRVHPIDFLMDKVPKLAAAGFEIYGEEDLTRHRVNRHPPTLRVQVSSGIDWFDLQIEVAFGDQVVPLKEVLQALKRKKRYVKLADGTIGTIPEEWLRRYKHLFDLGEITAEDHLRVADYHAALVEEILEDEEAQIRAGQELRERIRSLKDVQGLQEVPPPKGLRGELRPYQVAGYRWLHFLHDNRFGGILADDMGLGKTVQVLAFLLSLRESGHPQAADLVVVPRSLLVNWQREVEKFTPDLKVLPYFGPARPDISALDEADLVLTTYGVMRVDADKLRRYHFHYIVLDESQAIKNPLSKTARAARRLVADHRLALTGTPVENTTFELWSQFAFVMPGLLGSLDYFKEQFAGPIERQGDEATARRLRRMIYPFILRRTKEQVAPELPPRTERVLYCDMEPAQRRLYHQIRDAYRAMLLGLIEEEGLDKARMKVLEGLLRLRQICNHPRLVKPKFRGDSGKMLLLMETLETLAAEGHKALVFSQFVQMLQLVRQALEERQLPYVYLDGSTTDRQTPVDRFQNDASIPFFLISLRAGGLGLNLTAADYVIQIDPWWNPAVERQAADRAHRIGQDKPVFIFKLITRDTVEEKILQLQQQKQALVEQLITTETGFLKNLTPEDVKVLFS